MTDRPAYRLSMTLIKLPLHFIGLDLLRQTLPCENKYARVYGTAAT